MSKTNASWPMANYMAAWKTFRRVGNEPVATAEHILNQPHWPKKDPLTILDVGCGDGRMLEPFLLKAQQTISDVFLLDPDDHLLNEAKNEIEALGLGCSIVASNGVAEIEGVELAEKADVGLGIHVAYLMPHARFRAFIEKWPAKVPLYVVLDAPTSVFSELWSKTAPEFATRAAGVHTYLGGGSARGAIHVKSTEFATRVANPYALAQPVQDLVLSLLCYSDYTALSEEVREYVRRTLTKFADREEVNCTCTCYEIVK